MNTYEFTLSFSLPRTLTQEEAAEVIYGAPETNDALVGIGINQQISLQFERVSESAVAAILEVIKDVKQLLPGIHLIEAKPDLVGLSDLSKVFGISRQAMRKIWQSNADFPPPIYEGSTLLWHLRTVLEWSMNQQARHVAPELFEVTSATMGINLARDLKTLKTLPSELLTT